MVSEPVGSGNEAKQSGATRRLSPIPDGELPVHAARVLLDRMTREVHPGCDLPVVQSIDDVLKDVELPS